MMSSVAKVKFIKTKVISRHHTKGVSNQVSSNSNYKIKSYSCSNSNTKVEKNPKTWEKTVSVTKRGNRGKFYGLQTEASEITIRGSFRNLNSGQKDYKSGQGLQIGEKRLQIRPKGIFIMGQGLQIGAEHGSVGRVHSKEYYFIFTYTFLAFFLFCFCFSSKNLCFYHFQNINQSETRIGNNELSVEKFKNKQPRNNHNVCY